MQQSCSCCMFCTCMPVASGRDGLYVGILVYRWFECRGGCDGREGRGGVCRGGMLEALEWGSRHGVVMVVMLDGLVVALGICSSGLGHLLQL